jgi:Lon protease-like protein
MSFELPLFPLNVVLFPGMQLPLHIFEPRYRLMTRRVMEADATFGVALIAEGEEGEPNTLPASVGCTAEIVDSIPFEDGRLNLMTVGRRRFKVLAIREEDEYLIGTCEWLDDEPALEEEKAKRVKVSLQRYLVSLAHSAHLADSDLDKLDVPDDPYLLSMWIAALIALPNEQKQELLELTSTRDRLEIEHIFLQRGEIVHRAYERRLREEGFLPTPSEGEDKDEETDEGPFSQFISLN